MKNKKKSSVLALITALLIAAVMAVTCTNPTDFSGLQGGSQDYQAPPGMGYVRLNVKDSNARTIMPDTSGYTNPANFTAFDIIFTATNDAANSDSTSYQKITYTALTAPIPLAPDTYTITVIAYSGTDPNYNTMATGEVSGIIITATDGSPAAIQLKEMPAGGGNGIFTWNLNVAAYDTASLDVIVTSTGASYTGFPVNLKTTNSASEPILSGVYRVEISLTQDGKQSVKVIEALHIYQNFTSTYSETLPTLRTNRYDVTYYWMDGGTPATSVETTVNHGDNFNVPANPTARTVTGANPSATFDGFFTNIGLTTPFTNVTGVIRDIDLYLKWASLAATISITFNPSDAIPPELTVTDGTNPITTFDINGTMPVLEITLDNASSYTSWVWYIDGTPNAETGATLTIDTSADITYSQRGGHVITVYADSYTATVTIDVTDSN